MIRTYFFYSNLYFLRFLFGISYGNGILSIEILKETLNIIKCKMLNIVKDNVIDNVWSIKNSKQQEIRGTRKVLQPFA